MQTRSLTSMPSHTCWKPLRRLQQEQNRSKHGVFDEVWSKILNHFEKRSTNTFVDLLDFAKFLMQVLLLLFCSVVLGSLSDFDRAEELLRTNPREAEALFSTLILADPKDFVPVMGQGYARYMQKKYYDCQTSFQR
jgi:hypothetical protein